MKSKLEALGLGTAIVGLISTLIFSPVITFGCAYFGGWILKLVVGEAIASGMNLTVHA